MSASTSGDFVIAALICQTLDEGRKRTRHTRFSKAYKGDKKEAWAPPKVVVTDNIFYTVRFGNNSTTVQSKDIENLKYELSKINPQDGKIFMLSGFADKSGNAAYNMKLSKLRVKAVKNEFLKYGINDVNLVERFFGSDKASDDVNENDRKVVIRILN